MSTLNDFCRGTNMTPEQLLRHYDPLRSVGRMEQMQRLRESWEVLYWQALRARNMATSYRDFKVGCALLAFREDASDYASRWKVFYGMNTKIESDSRPVCAEPIALLAARAADYTEVLGIVVVGLPQVDAHSGRCDKTLHPCRECRLLLASCPIMKPHTRIVTATPFESGQPIHWEIHTLRHILRLHNGTNCTA